MTGEAAAMLVVAIVWVLVALYLISDPGPRD